MIATLVKTFTVKAFSLIIILLTIFSFTSKVNAWTEDDTPVFKSYIGSPGYLYRSYSIAVDDEGNSYTLNYDVDKVIKYDPEGLPIFEFGEIGTGDGQFDEDSFSGSSAIAYMGEYLYIVDQGNTRIQKFDLEGNFILKWGSEGEGDGQFQNNNILFAKI